MSGGRTLTRGGSARVSRSTPKRAPLRGLLRVRFQRSAFRAAIRRDGYAVLVAKESLPNGRKRARNPVLRPQMGIVDEAVFHSGLALRAIHFLLPLINYVS